jgi:hypothetical protein
LLRSKELYAKLACFAVPSVVFLNKQAFLKKQVVPLCPFLLPLPACLKRPPLLPPPAHRLFKEAGS